MSLLAKLRKVDDTEFGWLDDEGVSWDGPQGYIAVKVLGFCGCGRPEDALEYVRDALRLIAMGRPLDPYGYSAWFKEVYRPAVDDVFHGDTGAEYFMWYFLDNKEFTQHGGTVPGGLTDKGKALLADLETMDFA